ncbi:Tumor protein p53-inducible nuclear protein 1, partial [Stegodyphus mimosarum]
MWGSFKSYFGHYCPSTIQTNQQKESEDIESWVFIDINGKEIKEIDRNAESLLLDNPKQNCESRLNPLPLLDISNTSSTQSSPQLSPTKIEEGWLVAPPPCFTLNCPSMIEISPLEDLLIEHPSMSVYSQIPNSSLAGKKVEESKEVIIQSENEIKSGSYSCERNDEQNPSAKVCEKNRVRSLIDLKGLMDQTENMKPAQQAKWENDQYKLCPSYINRQNRVHRYQSRK